MSVKLDPKEVLEYLNELGYCNITAEQLKEFMKDLKKLIKYDMKKGLVDKENNYNVPCGKNRPQISEKTRCPYTEVNHKPKLPKSCESLDYHCTDKPYVHKYVDEIFSNLYSASTVSSRAKSVQSHHQPNRTPSIPNVSFAPKKSKSEPFITSSDESVQSSFYTESENFRSTARSKSNTRPKSFIRPALSLHSSKSDPVSLYQRYQESWKRHKLPGEENHKQLRWAIREKMLSGPDIKPMPVTRKIKL